jgi:hypothetical protein
MLLYGRMLDNTKMLCRIAASTILHITFPVMQNQAQSMQKFRAQTCIQNAWHAELSVGGQPR